MALEVSETGAAIGGEGSDEAGQSARGELVQLRGGSDGHDGSNSGDGETHLDGLDWLVRLSGLNECWKLTRGILYRGLAEERLYDTGCRMAKCGEVRV